MTIKLKESTSLLPEQLVMFVSANVRKERLSMCNACEHAKPIPLVEYRRCELCNCVIELKTTIKATSCPIAKWSTSTENYEQ
jgi:hypothetical protein